MIKNKLVAVLGVPAGAVWLIDNFVTNMPHVMEGGVFVAGVAGALLGAKSVKRLLHTVTAEQPAEQGDVSRETEQGEDAPPAAAAPTATVHALPAPERVQEALQQAFLMGAQAAKNQQQLGR